MARLNRKKAESMVELDETAALALIGRHLDEYEWILERTWHEQTVSRLKEEIDALLALNPKRRDAVAMEQLNPHFANTVALQGRLDDQDYQIEQAVMPLVRTLPVEQQDRLDWLMSPVNEYDYDDEYEEEPIWEEIGYVEEASKRLIKEHPQEYRKIVESIDLDRLHREIDSLKGQIATRDNQIRKLVAKNPQNTNVPALLKTTETFRAELERLDFDLVKPKKKRTRKAKGA